MLGYEVITSSGQREACNLAGRTTPAQLAAVLAQCDLLIGIDSGPMHVAAAMGRPVVGLFGPSDPGRTGPMGEGHEVIFHQQGCWRPCIHPVVPNCTVRKCMEAITVEEVVAAAERIITRLSNGEVSGGGGAVHGTR
jgi:ADP-heptose:LPS heptosyltransferase